MSRITIETAENLAVKMRGMLHLSDSEPINIKTVLRKLRILTLFRPLSDTLYGLSAKSYDAEWKFILVNSNTMQGRQNFTVAHELYHLYYDDDPHIHFCREGLPDSSERSANLFAGAFLMPRSGLIQRIPDQELLSRDLSLTTLLDLEALFAVSHTAMLVRLKELKLIRPELFEKYSTIKVIREANLRGMDVGLYMKGNEGMIIGDFGAKAKELYDRELISEGHYVELMNMIGYGCEESQDCAGC